MAVRIVSKETHRRYKVYKKIYPSRRAAFRAAKRDNGIPVTKNPDEVIIPETDLGEAYDLDDRNVRLYIFDIFVGAVVVQYHIREDKEAFYGGIKREGDQGPHFNSGSRGTKLKKHHYWKK